MIVRKWKDYTPEEMARYLRRQNAYLVVGVVRSVIANPGFRGKVNLGLNAGARGRNTYLTRPVESASGKGLIDASFEKGAYVYHPNDFGKKVIEIYDEIRGERRI